MQTDKLYSTPSPTTQMEATIIPSMVHRGEPTRTHRVQESLSDAPGRHCHQAFQALHRKHHVPQVEIELAQAARRLNPSRSVSNRQTQKYVRPPLLRGVGNLLQKHHCKSTTQERQRYGHATDTTALAPKRSQPTSKPSTATRLKMLASAMVIFESAFNTCEAVNRTRMRRAILVRDVRSREAHL